MIVAFLVLAISTVPVVTVAAYLTFTIVCFTIPMLTSSGWAEALHVRELAVGAAAINTMSQIGAFVTPYAWGAAKDASGSFRTGLVLLFLMTIAQAALVLKLRRDLRGPRVAALAAA
jgi:ACS family tartrate transporter-like MFS transporter